MADKKTASRPVEPIRVTTLKLGDASKLTAGSVGVTDGVNQPNVVVSDVVQPIVAMAIRAGFLFGKTILGLLAAAMTPEGGKLLYTGDFLALLVTCASLSFPVTVLGSIQDIVTIFGRLEGRFPLLTGKV